MGSCAMDEFLLFVAVGFAAQLIDGAIGMAYGLSSTTILLNFGVPPATASASVHAAEVFTAGASAVSHLHFRNVVGALFRPLAIAGMAGGAAGAWLLASTPAGIIRPVVSLYLLVMGALILLRVIRNRPRDPRARPLQERPWLLAGYGAAGGFLDAVGGGGWGPMVTSTLIGSGVKARFAIGSSNAAEFFVAAVVSATFILTIGLELWPIITGLVIGGILAAPYGALAARHFPERPLMAIVAIVIMLLSTRGLVLALGDLADAL